MANPAEWAARCLFFKQLWERYQRRIIFDATLQQELLKNDSTEQIMQLLFAEQTAYGTTWVPISQNQDSALSQRWPQIEFVEAANLLGLIKQANWQLAVMDLSSLDPGEHTRVIQALMKAGSPQADRQIILMLSAEVWTQGLSNFGQWIGQFFQTARIYTMAPLATVAVIDCGDIGVTDGDEQTEVSVDFDNSLGGHMSHETYYLAFLNFHQDIPEGMSVIELPPLDGGFDGAKLRRTDVQARTEVLYAQIQTLRWQLEQAQAEVRRLTQRPIHELEAELATLYARLSRFES